MLEPAPLPLAFHFFDHGAERTIIERRLPHWSQAGTVCFITWRTVDSMPATVLAQWFEDRARWLRNHGIDPTDPNWMEQLQRLEPSSGRTFLDTFWNRWHDELDSCNGLCLLRRPELSEIVAKSLYYFDGQRYLLLDFVIMPNHAHLLVVFPNQDSMLAQCESWKHYTATQINRKLRQRGRFWQQEAFDHLIRSESQFEYLRKYIAQNPIKAKLGPGEYMHYSRPLENSDLSPYPGSNASGGA